MFTRHLLLLLAAGRVLAAQSRKRLQQLVALADATEINALVIDIKDEFGINY